MQRLFIGLGLGVGVTFALFVLMAYLIKVDARPPKREDGVVIQIGMVEPDEQIRRKDRRIPKKPPPPKNPPPPQTSKVSKVDKPLPNMLNIKMTKLDVSASGDGPFLGQMGGAGNMGDGEAIPQVIIEPQWPRKALLEGISGWVTLEFTIMPDGTPKDVRVIDAEPKRLFERNAQRAIYKWKFKPRVEDGRAVEQPNMRYTLEFKLEE